MWFDLKFVKDFLKIIGNNFHSVLSFSNLDIEAAI